MKTKYILIIGLVIFLISFTSASSINFYYSPNCPHCQNGKPLINSLKSNYIQWQFNFIDITK